MIEQLLERAALRLRDVDGGIDIDGNNSGRRVWPHRFQLNPELDVTHASVCESLFAHERE